MPLDPSTIQPGRCYEMNGGAIRQVIEVKKPTVRYNNRNADRWHGPNQTNLDQFARDAKKEVPCPT